MNAKWKLAAAFLLGLTAFAACAATNGSQRVDGRVIAAVWDGGPRVLAVDDPTNGVTCYVTEKWGDTGLAISCVKVTP